MKPSSTGRRRRGLVARFGQSLSKGLMAVVQATFIASTLLVMPIAVAPVAAANPSANLDQCANDPLPSSHLDGCNSTSTQWVNGNLGASKSVYFEGDSIPYRLTFGNLSTSGSHVVKIEWDTTKASKHAIDYLTTYNATVANANPCLGVSGCSGSGTPFAIPKDPQVDNGSGSPITQPPGNFTIFGGTIDSVSAYSYSHGTGFTGDKSASISITFHASVANPVIAWGGHIATRQAWGASNSAISISGSPYHTRLLDLDGSGGNQDRSLSADAVIFPGSITIVKDATPNGTTSFAFTASPSPLTAFNLVDDGTVANNTKVFGNITNFTTYTVAETAKSGWDLTGRNCTVTSPNGGSQTNSGTTGIAINLKEGENVTCTFSNSPTPAPHLAITKDATEASYDATTDTIHYTIVATNDGNTTLAAVTVTDTEAVLGTCTPANGSPLAPGASMTCSASHAVTQADIDAGTYNNTACVDDGTGGAASICDDADVPAVQNPALTLDKSSTTSAITAAGQVVPYSYLVTNTGNVTLTGITVTDNKVASVSCPATTLAPGASMTCTGSHTVTAAEFAAGGNLTNIATADSDQTSPVQDTLSIPITPPTVVGQITPTQTTCTQFNAGTAGTLSELNYSIKGGKVSAVNPGVFFYWIKVTAVAGSNTFTVTQAQDDAFPHFFDQASGTAVYNSGCSKVGTQNITTSGGVTTVTFTAPTAGTYIIGIKYDSKSIQGFAAPAGDVHYTFATVGVPGSSQGLTLNHP